MKLLSKRTVTLNIEGTELRLLVVRGKQVEEWSSISLEPGLVKDGLILDLPAVSATISQLITEQGIKEKEIITSLSGFQSVQRFPDLPKLSPQLMKDALMREAKKTMPVPLEQLYLSWQVINEQDDLQEVFLLGIPQNTMDAEIHCLREAGVTPHIMDLKPLALARMINRPEALIIDIEMESCDIVVISGGIPIIMRSLTMHSYHSLARRVQNLVEEFERTLQFYESSHPNEPLGRTTPLFLTGGLAGDTEVAQAVMAGVEYRVEPLESPLEAPPDLPVAQFAVNIGLALKSVSFLKNASIPEVNILPEIYRPHPLSTKQVLLVPGLLAAMALIFPLYQMATSATTDVYRAQAEYDNISQQLQVRKRLNEQVNQLENTITQVEQKHEALITELQELSSGRSEVYSSLYLVAVDVLPAGASLVTTSWRNNELQLQGTAASYEIALDYAYALRETEKFSTVWVSMLSSAEDKVNFTIILR